MSRAGSLGNALRESERETHILSAAVKGGGEQLF